MVKESTCERLIRRFGTSRADTAAQVIEAHGGIEGIKEAAAKWGERNYICGEAIYVAAAYGQAVELGYRIAKKELYETTTNPTGSD